MNNRGGDSKGKFGTPNLNSSNRDGLPSITLNGKNQIGGKQTPKGKDKEKSSSQSSDDINDSDSKDDSEIDSDEDDEIKDTVNHKLVEEQKKAAPIPRITSAYPQPPPKFEPVKRTEPTAPAKSPSKPDFLKDSTYSAHIKGFESDEQFQKYLSSLTEYDRSRYQQLLQKNRQLKEDLRKIAHQTEELIAKEKDKKFQKPIVEENEEIQGKMKVLKQQQFHISNLKAKISEKRAELDENKQYDLVREKEDELKDLRRRLKELMDERATVCAARDEQAKVLDKLKGGEDQEKKKDHLLEDLKSIKLENKLLIEKKTELERELKKNHSKMFDGKLYVRELQRRIEQHKKRFPNEEMRGITEEDIDRLKEKIKDLEEERNTKISTHDRDMKDIDYMRRELERENERLQRILTEKDRDMRINSLKMKELKRIQRTRASRPLKSRLLANQAR